MVILNKPINIAKEGDKPSLARLMITSAGVVALDASPHRQDYLDGTRGVRAARREGITVNATIKRGSDFVKSPSGYSFVISPEHNTNNNIGEMTHEMMQEVRRRGEFSYSVSVLEMDFQDSGKIQQAIRESHQEAQDLNKPKIRLLANLINFTETLEGNPGTSPQPPGSPGPTA